MDLKGFDLEHWWKMLAGGGAAIAVASIAVKLMPMIFVGLGLFLIGLGEWINHPYQERVDAYGRFKISGHLRTNYVAGWLLDCLGLVLAAVGLAKLFLTT